MKKDNFFMTKYLLPLAIMCTSSSCIFVDSESTHIEDEDSFLILSQEVVEFYYSPKDDGDRVFYTWHEDDFLLPKSISVKFYWTDESDDYDDWHMWKKRFVKYDYKGTRERMHSDDKYIGYLMEYTNHSDEKVRIYTIMEHEH